MMDKMRGVHIAVDKTKLRKALLRRQLTMRQISEENYYSHSWLAYMSSKGYVTAVAMEILKKYGITEEEIRP